MDDDKKPLAELEPEWKDTDDHDLEGRARRLLGPRWGSVTNDQWADLVRDLLADREERAKSRRLLALSRRRWIDAATEPLGLEWSGTADDLRAELVEKLRQLEASRVYVERATRELTPVLAKAFREDAEREGIIPPRKR